MNTNKLIISLLMMLTLQLDATVSKNDLNDEINAISDAVHHVTRDWLKCEAKNFLHGGLFGIFHHGGKISVEDVLRDIVTTDISRATDRLNMSKADQKSESVVTNIMNDTDIFYTVIDLKDNSVPYIIKQGHNVVSLRLDGPGYKLKPYRGLTGGYVSSPIQSRALNDVGGEIFINPKALNDQGLSVSQTSSPIKNFKRSHAVVLWPDIADSDIFAHGMPVSVVIELSYLPDIKELVFPRIVSTERLGVSSMSFSSIYKGDNASVKACLSKTIGTAVDSFNTVLADSNYDYTTESITRKNSVDGNNNTIPVSGPDVWMWADVPTN